MKTTILLDCDGPLADCSGDVLELFGVWREKQSELLCTYDAITEFLKSRMHHGAQGAVVVPPDPWYRLGNDINFWHCMTEQPWFERLVAHCRSLADTVVCTKPLAYGACAAGKLEWCLERDLPVTIVRAGKAGKEVLASPWHLLIDDAEHQVEAFRDAGGRAYLWPMPWNEKGDALEYGLDRALDEIAELVRAPCPDCDDPELCEYVDGLDGCPG